MKKYAEVKKGENVEKTENILEATTEKAKSFGERHPKLVKAGKTVGLISLGLGLGLGAAAFNSGKAGSKQDYNEPETETETEEI